MGHLGTAAGRGRAGGSRYSAVSGIVAAYAPDRAVPLQQEKPCGDRHGQNQMSRLRLRFRSVFAIDVEGTEGLGGGHDLQAVDVDMGWQRGAPEDGFRSEER